jgi:putative aldouronate transport system permease protein
MKRSSKAAVLATKPAKQPRVRLLRNIKTYKYIYLMYLLGLCYYLLFHYGPMYGALVAFKEFIPAQGVWGSPWVGFKHFSDFFHSHYAGRIIRNTILINIYQLVFAFPIPIIFALLLNEIKKLLFKKVVQTVSYLPHFITLVVVCGIIIDFTARDGVVNDIIAALGGKRDNLLLRPELFRTIYISTNIWQEMGWRSIIYLAALSGINPELYDACAIDGARRWGQMLHVTVPGILPIIVILFNLQAAHIMSLGFEKIILLYTPANYETADVISSFIYRKGILEANYSYSTAVGLFNSAVNFVLVVTIRKISARLGQETLW